MLEIQYRSVCCPGATALLLISQTFNKFCVSTTESGNLLVAGNDLKTPPLTTLRVRHDNSCLAFLSFLPADRLLLPPGPDQDQAQHRGTPVPSHSLKSCTSGGSESHDASPMSHRVHVFVSPSNVWRCKTSQCLFKSDFQPHIVKRFLPGSSRNQSHETNVCQVCRFLRPFIHIITTNL